ncbi:MAG: UDP-N-acetylglucosamine 2-epimerase (non-hydrolyzing) [Myxococcaceae bacterium]|nr:UDP-N-acetylglucosamine 2-epimerase (non-hydrolyzing) [Myxococcaceae bacterium]
MKLGLLVGTRPNFVKAAAVLRALTARGVTPVLIHTGQHHDARMSDAFFTRLQLPAPDHHLGVSSGSRGEQLGAIVTKLATLLPTLKLDELIVVGDVTSTAAGAIAADAIDLRVSHVEAGLRSFDLAMPEERNRKLVDAIAQRLFVTEQSGLDNLRKEGHGEDQLHLVGNVMIDTLLRFKAQALESQQWKAHGCKKKGYAVATLHRPSNVDEPSALAECLAVLAKVGARWPVLFAAHPRTQQRLQSAGLPLPEGVRLLPPQEYLDFIGLMAGAAVVLTDSGGAQEETSPLGVPCLTLRENTERPVTLTHGTSRLVGRSVTKVEAALADLDAGKYRLTSEIPLWDGKAAERIAGVLLGDRR